MTCLPLLIVDISLDVWQQLEQAAGEKLKNQHTENIVLEEPGPEPQSGCFVHDVIRPEGSFTQPGILPPETDKSDIFPLEKKNRTPQLDIHLMRANWSSARD